MRTANLKKRGRFRRSRLLVARSSRRFGPVSRASRTWGAPTRPPKPPKRSEHPCSAVGAPRYSERLSQPTSLAAQRELHGDLHHALHGARAATGGHERPLLYGAERSVVEDPLPRGGGDAHVHDAAVRAEQDGENDDALDPLLARGRRVGRQRRVAVGGRRERLRGPHLERREQDDVGGRGRRRERREAQREEQEEADCRQRYGLVTRGCYT